MKSCNKSLLNHREGVYKHPLLFTQTREGANGKSGFMKYVGEVQYSHHICYNVPIGHEGGTSAEEILKLEARSPYDDNNLDASASMNESQQNSNTSTKSKKSKKKQKPITNQKGDKSVEEGGKLPEGFRQLLVFVLKPYNWIHPSLNSPHSMNCFGQINIPSNNSNQNHLTTIPGMISTLLILVVLLLVILTFQMSLILSTLDPLLLFDPTQMVHLIQICLLLLLSNEVLVMLVLTSNINKRLTPILSLTQTNVYV